MSSRALRRFVLALVAVLCVEALVTLVAFGRVATGYAAVVATALHFGTGDSLEQIREERLRLPLGLERALTLEATADEREVGATFLGVISTRARWRDGLGATRGAPLVDLDALEQASAAAPAAPRWPSAEPQPTLERALDRAFHDGASRGSHAVAVLHHGQLVGERYRDGYDGSTPLLGWSMAKSVTATLVARALQLGLLDGLDEPAPVPEWGVDDPRAAITVRQLLRMQSGLAFDSTYVLPWSDSLQMLFVSSDVGAFAAGKPLAYAPGTHWAYADGTSNLLARLVHTQAGASLEERAQFPARALFEPLGMTSATFSVDGSGVFVGSSLVQASAHDWLRLGALYLADGVHEGERLLPEGWVDFVAQAGPDASYGAHFWLFDVEAGDALEGVFFAAGFGGQALVIDRRRDLCFVRLGVAPRAGSFDVEPFARDVIAALEAD